MLTLQELEITSISDASILLKRIAASELSAFDVIGAFLKRAAFAQQLIGCCTEMLFEEAMERAWELDRVLAETGRTVGPLHGLPISVKDIFDVKGHDSTVGGCPFRQSFE